MPSTGSTGHRRASAAPAPPKPASQGPSRPRIAARARAAPAAHGSGSPPTAGTATSAYFPARTAAVRVDAVRSQACWATSAAASSTAARVVDGAPMSASSPRTPTGPPPRPVRCGSAPTGRNTGTPRPRRPASGPARCGWSTPVRQNAIDVGAIVDVRPRSGRCQRRLDDQVLDCAEVRISLTPRLHPACRSQSTAVRRACPAASASARATRGPPDAVRARRRHPLSGPGRAPVARRPSHAAAARTPPAALPP